MIAEYSKKANKVMTHVKKRGIKKTPVLVQKISARGDTCPLADGINGRGRPVTVLFRMGTI
jgi:hypothetical protein